MFQDASSFRGLHLSISFQVKEIEKRDSVLTPKQQIERLLRPGSSYFNLNPFEVLQIDPATTVDEVKKKYRRVSSQCCRLAKLMCIINRCTIKKLSDQ